MPRRLLIIESRSLSPTHGISIGEAARGAIWEQVEWRPDLYDVVRQKNPDLLIVVALSATEQATNLLLVLQRKPLLVPVLAIIPDLASADFFRVASRIVDDFVVAPPVRASELQQRIARIIGDDGSYESDVDKRLIIDFTMAGLVGRDPAFLSAISKIPQAARGNGPVLITGETGTGKELCARAIHNIGPRREHSFIPIDCATTPEHLFESELFGYVRGAFTGASSDHRGLVALANGGTLFLDEIDSLSLAAQSKLLRLIQERSYRPLGSEQFQRVNASILAATNSDLRQLIRTQKFRADLFFRLNVLRVDLVPLRSRPDDIGPLARHFIEQACTESGIPAKSLSPAALRKLCQHDWPGNVRELNNVIRRAVVFCRGSTILPSDIDADEVANDADGQLHETFRQARSRVIESFEKRYVGQLMQESGGNVSLAARLAGKERRAFGRLVKRYAIKHHTF